MRMKVEIDVPEGYELLTNSASSMLVDEINKVVAFGFNIIPKHDPHAELKAQYALDVETCKSIDGLEAWQLWQYRYKNSEWFNCPSCVRWINEQYRRHPHADSIIAYHKCSDADKKRWQARSINAEQWIDIQVPNWYEAYEYRLKPRTITINGVEYNAPMNVAPKVGTEYWLLSAYDVIHYVWEGSGLDIARLECNHIFATDFDCQAVCDAFKAILLGE